MNVTAVIPTLNPSEKIFDVTLSLLNNGFKRIIIVNDGSSKECQYIFNKLSMDKRCVVLEYQENKGKGYALKTAMKYFIKNPLDDVGILTLDDDGQHTIDDVINCAIALENNPKSLILGVRDFNSKNVPFKSKFGNKITRSFLKHIIGTDIKDTQTGLRGIPLSAISKFIRTEGNRFEYETNMLLSAKKHGVSIKEVTIETVYENNNKSSHFNPFKDSVKIYKQLFKYLYSSILAVIINIGLFALLMLVLRFDSKSKAIFFATVISGLVSMIIGSYNNYKFVFYGKKNINNVFIKYFIFSVFKLFISFWLTNMLSAFFNNSPVIIFKIISDIILFFSLSHLKSSWVFNHKHKKNKNISIIVIKKSLSYLGSLLLVVIIALFSAITITFNGPSPKTRNLLVNTLMETSAMKFIPRMYFSEKQINEMTIGNQEQIDKYVKTLGDVKINVPSSDNNNDDLSLITVEDVTGSTFVGKMMIVRDPSRISVFSIDNFSETTEGALLSEIVKKDDIIGGFNAGGFYDAGGSGKGGMPAGVVFKNGKLLCNTPSPYPTLIGFDNNNKLIVDNISAEQAKNQNIKDAVSFGPILIKNGVKIPQSGSGGGLNPRTAIGQRADGSVLILSIDGRQPHSLGATYMDTANVMADFGAVTAGNLDGGSSSMLFYKGKLLNSLSSAVGERKIPTAFLIKR